LIIACGYEGLKNHQNQHASLVGSAKPGL